MLRWSHRRVRIYVASAIVLALVLGFEAWVVTRHSVGADDLSAGHATARPDRDARPLPRTVRVPEDSHIDLRLSRVATKLGRGRAEVRCWSTAEWYALVRELDQGPDVSGYTTIDAHRVHLPWHACIALRVAAMRTFPRDERAEALATFAHELEHLGGIDDEARAECYSHQNLAAVAQALGASRDEAQELRRVAWREFYPPSDPDYVSAECRNGGRLDLHPKRSSWP
jgi:hypothetical protein